MGRSGLSYSDVLSTKHQKEKQKQKNTIKALRTPEQIREEMKQLNALRPDWCRTAQDWIALQRFQALYAEWIESVVVSSDHKKDQS